MTVESAAAAEIVSAMRGRRRIAGFFMENFREVDSL
jgi:hypothetical protein